MFICALSEQAKFSVIVYMVFVTANCDQRQSTAHHGTICRRRRRCRQREQVLLELWNFRLTEKLFYY